jgi:anaerobic selenocysteine-containing dehydrogenase
MSTSNSGSVKEDVSIKTACYGCPAATCGLIARRVDGVVVELRGDPRRS